MLPITYYFWNSYKKSGYVRWKLDQLEYDKQVRQQWKDSNVFVKKLVDSVLEDQAKTVKDNITTLEIQYNNADKESKRIQSLKNEEENKISIIFANKKQILEQEKSKIEEDYENNTLLEAQQLKWAKNLLKNLLELLSTYAEEVKKWITNQSERLLSQRKNALKHNTRITAQEIKESISPKDNKEKEEIKKWWKWSIQWKSLWYFFILWVMCLFDIFLGYLYIKKVIEWVISSEILVILLGFFFSATIIPLIIFFIHVAVVARKRGGISRVLWVGIFAVVVSLAVLYAGQSLEPETWRYLTTNFSIWTLFNILQDNLGFLLRCFIIPSLLAWEIVIDLIDRDCIIDYFWIWKRKWSNSLSKLITNWLYFLKSRKISNYAKEEKKAINDLINEMQKEDIPAFSEIKKDIKEVQSIIDPIRNKQAEKQEEYNQKLAIMKNKMEKNLEDYNMAVEEIEKKYAPEINRLEGIKRLNEIKINKLNHDLNQASIDVKEWILIWLIDK